MLWFRATLVWALLAVLMVAHGALRERFGTPRLGELRAHQISCFTGALLIVTVAYLTLGWIQIAYSADLQLRVGALWLALTVVFEFAFGRWVAGLSWSRLVSDYDLREGRLWVLVLITTLLSPRLAGWLHGWCAA